MSKTNNPHRRFAEETHLILGGKKYRGDFYTSIDSAACCCSWHKAIFIMFGEASSYGFQEKGASSVNR